MNVRWAGKNIAFFSRFPAKRNDIKKSNAKQRNWISIFVPPAREN
jgi:hypothetical protein